MHNAYSFRDAAAFTRRIGHGPREKALGSENARDILKRITAASLNDAKRLSVTAQITSHTLLLTGTSPRRFFSDPDVFITRHLAVSEYYGLDAPSLYYDMYNIEAEALGQKLVWLDDMFPEIDGSVHLIDEPRTLDRLRSPDPRKDGRMPFILEVYKRLADIGLSPKPRFCAPFSLAANLRGLNNLLLDILIDPEFAHRLLRFVTLDVLAPWITTLRQVCGPNAFALGADALASLPITNLEVIREYALAYTLRLREAVGSVGVGAWWGERFLKDPRELFAMKVQANPGQLKGYDPDVHAVGPEAFAAFAKEHGCAISLGVESLFLRNGPAEAVVDRVRSYVEAMDSFSTANLFLNEVSRECPPEHVHAAIQAAKYFRKDQNSRTGRFAFRPVEPFDRWAEAHGVFS